MQKKKTSESEELYGLLGQVFNFTQGDLEANRAGFISHRQQEIHRKESIGIIRGIYLLVIFFVGIGLLLLYFGFDQARTNAAYFVITPLSLIMPAIIIYTIMQYARHLSKIHDAEMTTKRVTEIICQKSRGLIETGRSEELVLVGFTEDNDRRVFSISEDAYNRLSNQSYRLYYLPASREILSLEANLPE